MQIPGVLYDESKHKKDRSELFQIVLPSEDKDVADDKLPAFMSKRTKNRIRQCFGNNESIEKTFSNVSTLQDIWRILLVEAIHFLRINDSRERAFLVHAHQGPSWQVEDKTTMSTDGAEDAALLNAYGVDDLFKYFETFSAFESVLYGSDSHYRDHVQHPFYVWLIGLEVLGDNVSAFKLNCSDKLKIEMASHVMPDFCTDQDLVLSSAEIVAMWTIIALTHDLGYPLQKVDRINSQLEIMLSQFGRVGFQGLRFSFESQHDHLVSYLLKILSSSLVKGDNDSWRTHRRPKFYAKFARSWEAFDHGIVSSLILMKSLTFFLECDYLLDDLKSLKKEDARQFAIRQEILYSVAAHTTRKFYHLSANTLAFLLVLCDDLQEWGRPTLFDLKTGGTTGSAELVRISRLNIKTGAISLDCSIDYPESEDDQYRREKQLNQARRVFRSWHERLRPAVDDRDRTIDFSWSMKFGKQNPWQFTIDSQKEAFKQISVLDPEKKPFQLYEDGSIGDHEVLPG